MIQHIIKQQIDNIDTINLQTGRFNSFTLPEENINGAFIAREYFLANLSISSISSGGNVVKISNFVPIKKA